MILSGKRRHFRFQNTKFFEIHQKFISKSKKSEKFSKKSRFFKKMRFSNIFDIFEKSWFFRKFFRFFFDFRDGFFYRFHFFCVLERKMSPLSRKYHVYLRNMLPQVSACRFLKKSSKIHGNQLSYCNIGSKPTILVADYVYFEGYRIPTSDPGSHVVKYAGYPVTKSLRRPSQHLRFSLTPNIICIVTSRLKKHLAVSFGYFRNLVYY